MRVLVCGGRDYADAARLFAVLDHYHAQQRFSVVIEGEASGADLLARQWAESRGVLVDPYPAAWTDMDADPCVPRRRRDGTIYNAAAGGIRNKCMLEQGRPDICIAFPGKTGTADMIRQAQRTLGDGKVLRIDHAPRT